jgi:hypothetical protein
MRDARSRVITSSLHHIPFAHSFWKMGSDCIRLQFNFRQILDAQRGDVCSWRLDESPATKPLQVVFMTTRNMSEKSKSTKIDNIRGGKYQPNSRLVVRNVMEIFNTSTPTRFPCVRYLPATTRSLCPLSKLARLPSGNSHSFYLVIRSDCQPFTIYQNVRRSGSSEGHAPQAEGQVQPHGTLYNYPGTAAHANGCRKY